MAPLSRRTFNRACLAAGVTLLLPGAARADEVAVPVRVQAELLVKVAGYDRKLVARASDRVVLLVFHDGDDESVRVAGHMRSELSRFAKICGRAHREKLVQFEDAASLARTCRAEDAAIVYLTPGLGSEIGRIADELAGIQVMTVASVAQYVPQRAVLGFDLVSGKPKLLVHLTQARRQRVDFGGQLLNLAKVYR